MNVPIELRSRADAAMLAINHAAALLPPNHPPADARPSDAMRALGAGSREWRAWMVWRALVLFRDAWQPWSAEVQQPQGERAQTMDRAP